MSEACDRLTSIRATACCRMHRISNATTVERNRHRDRRQSLTCAVETVFVQPACGAGKRGQAHTSSLSDARPWPNDTLAISGTRLRFRGERDSSMTGRSDTKGYGDPRCAWCHIGGSVLSTLATAAGLRVAQPSPGFWSAHISVAGSPYQWSGITIRSGWLTAHMRSAGKLFR